MHPSVIVEASSSAGVCQTGWTPRVFSWGPISKGHCTMAEGATWTLVPDGTATFAGTVTSGEDGATWVIWHVDLVAADGAVLGSLTTEHPVAGDWRKFVQAMPDGGEHYRFRAWASFDAALWNDIATLKMYSSC